MDEFQFNPHPIYILIHPWIAQQQFPQPEKNEKKHREKDENEKLE